MQTGKQRGAPPRRKYPEIDRVGNYQSYWINVYEVDRRYGGPEEGGWWYDAGEVEVAIDVSEADGDDFIDDMLGMLSQLFPEGEGANSASSVIYRGGDYRVCLEAQQGERYPERRPRYE